LYKNNSPINKLPIVIYFISSFFLVASNVCLSQAGRQIDTTGQSEKIKNTPMDTLKTGKGENSGVNKDYNKPKPEQKTKSGNTKTPNVSKDKLNGNIQPTTIPGTPIKGETVEIKKNSQNYHGVNPLHVDTTINKAPANTKLKPATKKNRKY
jgi:hypothetical protein